jgi:hypothetical protein
VVKNRRVVGGRVVQRHVLYLGEINSTRELAWRRSIEVMEGGTAQSRTLSLFPEDRCEGLLPDSSIVLLKLSEVRLRRPRQWGACWLALELWRALGLDRFWAARLDPSRKGTRWGQVLFVLVTYGLLAPGSEWRLHREWFERTALADLLGEDAGLAESHKLYRCHDRLLVYKQGVFEHLIGRWRELFNVSFDVLLYDLTAPRPSPGQALLRERPAVSGRRQASPRLFAGPPWRLRAGDHRSGGDAGRVAAGLRGAAG